MDLRRANRYNTKVSGRLWQLVDLPLALRNTHPSSEAFAKACASIQTSAGLTVDGMLGPKTLACIRAGARPQTAAAESPVLSPVASACPDAASMPEIDKTTYPLERGRRRTRPPRSIVLHDSVTRSARACHTVLKKRNLSTHYMIDEDGTIYECADPEERVTYHAAAWNARSIGIDMINLLGTKSLRSNIKSDKARRARTVKRPWSAAGAKKVIDYTPEQKVALIDLVRYLCQRFDIPYAAPGELTGYGKRLGDVDAKKYEGVVAHGQSSSKRWDGLLAVEVLHDDGAEAT